MAAYILMNKTTPVLEFEYDLDTHKATRVKRLVNPAAAPYGLLDRHGDVSKADLNYWWYNRAIPASRDQVDRLLENLNLRSTLELVEKNFGLSLSDRYWINDTANPQRWDDINFFDNDFSDDLGFLTLGQDSSSGVSVDYRSMSLSSPNSSLGGDLRKKWKIIDGKRVLVKAGNFLNQEPYNELIATELHRRLLEPGEFVEYRLLVEDRRTYSACDNMLEDDEELIAAWDFIRKRKQSNNLSDLQFYVHLCEEVGIEDVMDKLAKMFACDFVIANRDRHWRNFGLIRNVETLRVTRLAPIFDSGSCLWSNVEAFEVPKDFNYIAKPFKYNGMRPYDQIRLFEGHFGWLDADALEGFAEQVAEILHKNPNIAEWRIEAVVKKVRANIETLVAVSHY